MTLSKAALILIAGTAVSCRRVGKDWVVLPEKEALALTRPCSRGFPPGLSGYWKPSDREIGRAEVRFQDAVTGALARVPKNERPFAPRLYLAQYAGFFRGGRRVIYVNGVGSWPNEPGNDDMIKDWRYRAVVMCDGGLGSFGAVLDLDKDTVDSFAFNGTIGGPIRLEDPSDGRAAQPAP